MRAAAFAFILLLVGCSGAADERIGDRRTEFEPPSPEELQSQAEVLEASQDVDTSYSA